MSENKHSRARAIQDFAFLVAFQDADFLDKFELQVIKNLALEDGVIDEAEKAVLRGIFDRMSEDQASPEAWEDIKTFRKKYRV